jgi:hypothetical protein
MKKALLIFLMAHFGAILMCPCTFAGWLIYHKPDFKGRVIDAESKAPIKGAVVVAIYYSSPIITGPGGGSPYIIHVKETLTDGNGVFVIPTYTTLIQPNSMENSAEFIIYKPGYGSYPGGKATPDRHYVNPEEYFSGELGAKREMHWESGSQSKIIPVTLGLVELVKLETREERLKAIPSWVFGSASIDISESTPLLQEAINQEHKRLGVERLGR